MPDQEGEESYVRTSAWVDWMERNFVPSFTPVQTYRVDEATRARVYEKYAPYLGRRAAGAKPSRR